MSQPTDFPPLTAIAAVLFCAALMVALYQALFPRPARWGLVLVAFVLGGVLTVTYAHLLAPLAQRLSQITDVHSALRVTVLAAGLPEEAVKLAAAAVALFLFRRGLTPAEAFQAALFAALGFAAVENMRYAAAMSEVALPIAFGRGIVASFVHSMLGMIQGTFLAALVRSGWRKWYLPVLGYLLAATAHTAVDWGLVRAVLEFLQTKTVRPETVMAALPIVIPSMLGVLLVALWCLRRALWRAGAEDVRSADPAYIARLARWRRSGNALIVLGGLGLAITVAAAVYASTSGIQPQPAMTDLARISPEQLHASIISTAALAASPIFVILGWILRQKR